MSVYRKIVWFYKGYKEYTKNGFEAAVKTFVPADLDVDCTGKSYVITGANSGIGKCLAIAIAQRGGTIHMVCRDPDRGSKARDDLISLTNSENIHLHLVDLADPRNVCAFVKRLSNSSKKLDVLINNAGCMVEKDVNSDGIERNFATNSLTPHILTRLLEPLLIKSDQPRVVNVSSGGMLLQKLDIEDIQSIKADPYDKTMAYAQQKRQQVVMTEVHAAQNSKIFYAVMHPGWADTPAVQSAMPEFYEKMKASLRTADEGADTALWLAISDKALQYQSGLFFQDRKSVPSHLPLAWTKSSKEDNEKFMQILDDYLARFNAVR